MKHVDLVWRIENAKCGNHNIEIVGVGVKHLKYFGTCICKVNSWLKVFATDRSYGTMSTKVACTKYERELLNNGYTQIEDFNDYRLK